MPPKSSDHPRFEYLDALRGIAILGVLSIHSSNASGDNFPGSIYADAGRYGVQLFFMVSAFTIFMTLDSALAKGTSLFRDFYLRRFFRILPMFWFGIALYAVAPGRDPFTHQLHITAMYYVLTAVLLHGWHPFLINSVVPGGWSITVEGTFYLIAPFLFLWIRRWQTALIFFLLTFLPTMLCNRLVFDLYAHHWLFQDVIPDRLNAFLYFWFPSQVTVFACGILTYRIFKSLPPGFHGKLNGLLLLSCGAMAFYAIAGKADDGIVVRLIPPQAFLGLSLMLVVLGLATYPFPLLVNRATCFLGQISYSFYLTHFAILAFVTELVHRFLPSIASRPLASYATLFVITLLFAVPISYLTFRFIEQPFIALGRKLIVKLDSRMKAANLPAPVPAPVAGLGVAD
jgi:peptidoglycan/LPS O-acetylase OafA/YrhL